MATFTMYDEGIFNILSNAVDLDTDTFKAALTNTAPDAAAHDEFVDITEITAQNGYVAGGQILDNVALTETGAGTGIWQWTFDDETFTAAGGTFGPFRYAVVYSDTSTGDKLIGFADNGVSTSVADGNSFTLNVGSTGVIRFQEA